MLAPALSQPNAKGERLAAVAGLRHAGLMVWHGSGDNSAALVARADAARDAREWAKAARLYAAVVGERPADAGMWVQLGHMRRESGDMAGGEAAYTRAVQLNRHDGEVHFYLGHCLRAQGQRKRAVAAFAQAARLGFAAATKELLALGARDDVPEPAAGEARDWSRVEAAARVFGDGWAQVHDWEATAGYGRRGWDRFRRDITVRPPPGPLPAGDGVIVSVDARRAVPAMLRHTLRSLQDQSVRDWRASVAVDEAVLAHPVAGFAATDRRVTVTAGFPAPDGRTLMVAAGTVLHPEALAWLLFAARRTGAEAVFADQDRGVPDVMRGLVHAEPRLFGAFDRDFTPCDGVPALVLGRGSDAGAALLGAERVAHVPRVLATVLAMPSALAQPAPEPARTPQAPIPRTPIPRTPGGIAVVIPTRDQPEHLARAVASLRARAGDPGRIRPVLVDNRSGDPRTRQLLADFRAQGATVLLMDEPFNWSRANNLGAAAAGDAEYLLFMNDDVELLSHGWDDALAAALARPEIGAVGARLLYPDMTVQHAGMVFGMGDGPEHEGRGAAFDDPGPDGRLVARRIVAAVTGAFLGVSAATFGEVGGFDEGLSVGHSDVDFCLRVRAAARLVLYEPRIEALHHEGATRGRNVAPGEVLWDLAEARDLVRRWGRALADDPGVNPHWIARVPPFDGVREPPMHAIVAHIDRTASASPWEPRREEP